MNVSFLSSTAAVAALFLVAGNAGAQTVPAADTGNEATRSPAVAPAAPVSPFTITGSAGVVSQYRFRGISQSDNKPVVQGAFTIAHASGAYLSVWGSSASANNAVNIGGTEIDVYGGFAHALGRSGVTLDAGVYGYIYPGSRKAVGIDESYVEIYGSLTKNIGPVSAKAGVYWAPDQHYFNRFATASQFNVYPYAELSYAPTGTPITLHAHAGHTGGGFDYAGHDYVDYAVGAGYKWRALTFDLSLVGTDLSRADTRAADLALGTTDFHRAAKPVVVGSVTASF
ncbi:TorF family putative porin [Sphingomonas sp.]|uniref:TorF family putative porin n=1 Tax=Sphingomonas sp. TaxID=28214 RepID=UPI003CC5949C